MGIRIDIEFVEERQPNLCQLSCDCMDQFKGNERDNGEDADAAHQHHAAECAVGDRRIASREQKRRDIGDLSETDARRR
jgi:hypothetical protein